MPAPTMIPMKRAIIGKMWLRDPNDKELTPASYSFPEDMHFEADQSFILGNLFFRTDRNLEGVITLKKGDKIFLFGNQKRPEKQDPDFNVSILLPTEEAEKLIENSRRKQQEWREDHQETQAVPV